MMINIKNIKNIKNIGSNICFYFKIWVLMARNSLLIWFTNKSSLPLFLLGKIVRFIFYFGFLYFLVKQTNKIAGYESNQILFFTVTYVLIDTLSQFFFRSVYDFRSLVVSGDLDLILVKPIYSLFRVLMGGPDPVDLITIPPIIAIVIYIGSLLSPSLTGIIYYLLLLVNALLIAAAFHIAVLSLGIITLEVDHTIMIYRDLTSMGRFPIDIYKEPLKGILTFIIPVGIMMTIPAKALIGLISPLGIISALLFGISFFILSFKFWNFALRKYSSASS